MKGNKALKFFYSINKNLGEAIVVVKKKSTRCNCAGLLGRQQSSFGILAEKLYYSLKNL